MSTEEKELLFIEWLTKVNETLTITLLKVNDKIDITEDNYELLRALFRLYDNGDYLLYKQTANLTEEKPVQNGLFDVPPAKVDPHDDEAQILTK
jgi:hypothetical protein